MDTPNKPKVEVIDTIGDLKRERDRLFAQNEAVAEVIKAALLLDESIIRVRVLCEAINRANARVETA